MAAPEVLIPPLERVARTPEPSGTDSFATIRCPICKGVGNIDRDQYEGRVSIACAGRLGGPEDGDCDYHETHDLRGHN